MPTRLGCEKATQSHFDELQLGDFINLVKADYSVSIADAISRYKNGNQFFILGRQTGLSCFKTWSRCSLGWNAFQKTKAVKIPNATKSKVNLGFGADDIRPAANVDFLKASKVKVSKSFNTFNDIFTQNLKMNNGEKSERAIKKHAAEWSKIIKALLIVG